jgi:hypothetical protein
MSHAHVSAVTSALSRAAARGKGRARAAANAGGSQRGKREDRMPSVAAAVSGGGRAFRDRVRSTMAA